MNAPFHLIFVILAVLLFLLAGLGEFVAPARWPWSNRLIAWGLFCWALSTIVKS
jgi:hypothetical protein